MYTLTLNNSLISIISSHDDCAFIFSINLYSNFPAYISDRHMMHVLYICNNQYIFCVFRPFEYHQVGCVFAFISMACIMTHLYHASSCLSWSHPMWGELLQCARFIHTHKYIYNKHMSSHLFAYYRQSCVSPMSVIQLWRIWLNVLPESLQNDNSAKNEKGKSSDMHILWDTLYVFVIYLFIVTKCMHKGGEFADVD